MTLDKTKLLVLLIVAVVAVNYFNYVQEDSAKQIRGLKRLEQRIAREEELAKRFDGNVSILLQDEANASSFFFPESMEESLAMAQLEKQIKLFAKQSDLALTKLSWGEPNSARDSWYTVLPFYVSLRGFPSDFRRFYNALHSEGKLVVVRVLKLHRDNKRRIVEFSLQLEGFKIKAPDADK
jgi:Tfp pilus assembly protein PilO